MLAALLVALPIHVILEVVTGRSNIPGRFLGAVTAIAGIRVSEHGTQVKRGAFFIDNHVSWTDIPALAGSTRTAFVGHDGLAAMPVLRWLCSLNDTVFVARH